MKYIKIKNFEKHQHYHTKSITAWIKLYFAILDDYEFERLNPERKWYFVGLLLLAGKTNNKIPFDSNYIAKKIGGNTKEIEDMIISINNTLLIIIKDKIRRDKIREDSQNPNRQSIEKVKTMSRPKSNKNICGKFLKIFNKTINHHFEPTKTNLDFISDRYQEAKKMYDTGKSKTNPWRKMILVMRFKYLDWRNKPDMQQYLRPATLFNKTKFNSYVPFAIDWWHRYIRDKGG